MDNAQPSSNPTTASQEVDPIDVKELVLSILRNWYWIALCVILAFFLARLNLRYSVPIYQASGTILIKDKEGGGDIGGLSEEAVLQEIGILKPGNNINNEIQILKSSSLMQEVMDTLNLEIQYTGVGRIKDTEYYGQTSPILVDSIAWYAGKRGMQLEVQALDEQSYRLYNEEGEADVHSFDQPLIVKKDTLWLSYNELGASSNGIVNIRVGGSPRKYLLKLDVKTVGDYSSVLRIQMEDPVPEKASDIINTLIEVYNQAAIDDKNQVAKKTLDFIDERLRLLTAELSSVEGGLETYKENNSIPGEAITAVDFILSEISQYDNELTRQEIKLELLNSVEKMFTANPNSFDLIPANIVLEDAGGLDEQITAYNNLLLTRERLQRSAASENPQLQSLNQELGEMRNNITQSVLALRQNLQLSIRETQGKLNELQKRINQIPRQERELLEIKRQQNIKEALYLFLLQKKEETALSAAITVPNARVIDRAVTSPAPIAPKPLQIYAIFLVLGFILPVGAIFIRELLDNKVYSEEDINKYTTVPVLGKVAKNQATDRLVVKANSRTAIAEMFRLLRTNLTYLSTGDTRQTILITSGVSGDGKTFIAVNLSLSLALTNKRVVVVGMDLRKPKLSEYLTAKLDHESLGVTNFLIGEATIEEVILSSQVHDKLFLIPSGPIPPNPAELLSGPKIGELMTYLKQHFDYIIIDTAPIGLVADAFLLAPYTDISLFAVRYGKTEREMLTGLDEMRNAGKLKKPAIVLNGVKEGKGYGYGYGYGYYEEDKKKKKWLW
ncbi:GumC family protein [Lewinella sp. LCG006]|uniref:GumC family protein n=1 Tax=Lewinella sp. LCG006 TaxID=3231911 RepID=UPI0034603092